MTKLTRSSEVFCFFAADSDGSGSVAVAATGLVTPVADVLIFRVRFTRASSPRRAVFNSFLRPPYSIPSLLRLPRRELAHEPRTKPHLRWRPRLWQHPLRLGHRGCQIVLNRLAVPWRLRRRR